MNNHQTYRLFFPYRVIEQDDAFGLNCRTVVVNGQDEFHTRFADMLLIAAAQGRPVPEGKGWQKGTRSRLKSAIHAGQIYGLPRGMAVRSVFDLAGICTRYKVEITPVYEKLSEEEIKAKKKPVLLSYRARFSEKAQLSRRVTPIGLLETVWVGGKPALRVLRASNWLDLYEMAKSVTRVLPVGLREILVLTEGAIPTQEPNGVQVVVHRINGVTALVLSARNPKEVKDDQLFVEAKGLLTHPICRVKQLTPREIEGRIPNVVPADRRILQIGGVIDRGPNAIIQELTGHVVTVLLYGATDIGGNLAELLQLFVACLRTGLPGVFDIDNRAHTLGSYWVRILQPSIPLIGGSKALPEELYSLNGDEITMQYLLEVLGLPQIEVARHLMKLSVVDFYVALHREFVETLNQLFGTNVQISVLTGDQLFERVSQELTIGTAIRHIRETLQEDRVLGTRLDGTQIKLSQVPADQHDNTIKEWLQRNSAWPGGALTYLLMAALSHSGPVYLNLKDSRLGYVSKMAFEELGYGTGNQALAVISGVTRWRPKFATRTSGGDNIDPLVLWEMLNRYPDRVTPLLQAMIERWIFPLGEEDIALEQVFYSVYGGGWYVDRMWQGPNGMYP